MAHSLPSMQLDRLSGRSITLSQPSMKLHRRVCPSWYLMLRKLTIFLAQLVVRVVMEGHFGFVQGMLFISSSSSTALSWLSHSDHFSSVQDGCKAQCDGRQDDRGIQFLQEGENVERQDRGAEAHNEGASCRDNWMLKVCARIRLSQLLRYACYSISVIIDWWVFRTNASTTE